MDIKLILALAGTIIALIAYVPYLKDIFSRKTTPHAYTWLIWVLTQGTASVASWYGGGGFATLLITAGTVLASVIFLLSLKYGTKNITKSDTIVFILALLAIIVWWQLHNPLIAVFMVSSIDLIGYFPTLRKSYEEPYSETLLFWWGIVIASALDLLAIGEYNFLTVTYLAMQTIMNFIVVIVCTVRRRKIGKPAPVSI